MPASLLIAQPLGGGGAPFAATTARVPSFLLRTPHPKDAPRPPLSSAPLQAAVLTIDPCSSGLASSSFWGPLNGCSEHRRGPRTGVLQARRESHEGEKRNTVRGAAAASKAPVPGLGCHSPSFRAGLRTPSLPPSCSALSHLLLPPLSLKSFFLSFLLFPAAPPFFPPPSLASLSGMGAPPTSSPPAARPRLAGPVPEARAAPESAAAARAGTQLPPALGSGRGSPGDHVRRY